jgi:hypothetical protein
LQQGYAEKGSRKIYFFEKSHDFHGRLDFLMFFRKKKIGKGKMQSMNTVRYKFKEQKKRKAKRAMNCRTMI